MIRLLICYVIAIILYTFMDNLFFFYMVSELVCVPIVIVIEFDTWD